jgi:hypothetical protein
MLHRARCRSQPKRQSWPIVIKNPNVYDPDKKALRIAMRICIKNFIQSNTSDRGITFFSNRIMCIDKTEVKNKSVIGSHIAQVYSFTRQSVRDSFRFLITQLISFLYFYFSIKSRVSPVKSDPLDHFFVNLYLFSFFLLLFPIKSRMSLVSHKSDPLDHFSLNL